MRSENPDTVIFDTDVLIWAQRGHSKAAEIIFKTSDRAISIQTFMELLQQAKSKKHLKDSKDFISLIDCQLLPITENISHRAAIYVEEYTLAYGLTAGDALIAATAAEQNLILVTGNKKHFKAIQDLKIKVFNP